MAAVDYPLTPVHLGVMDSQKPPACVELPVRHLSFGARAGRGALRMLLISVPAACASIFPPHACGLSVALLGGPIFGLITAWQQALFGEADVSCPKCAHTQRLPERLSGWPARFSCRECKAMLELRPAREQQ